MTETKEISCSRYSFTRICACPPKQTELFIPAPYNLIVEQNGHVIKANEPRGKMITLGSCSKTYADAAQHILMLHVEIDLTKTKMKELAPTFQTPREKFYNLFNTAIELYRSDRQFTRAKEAFLQCIDLLAPGHTDESVGKGGLLYHAAVCEIAAVVPHTWNGCGRFCDRADAIQFQVDKIGWVRPSEEKSKTHFDAAMALLVQATEAGFENPIAHTDPDLDPLRFYPGFQEWIDKIPNGKAKWPTRKRVPRDKSMKTNSVEDQLISH